MKIGGWQKDTEGVSIEDWIESERIECKRNSTKERNEADNRL